MTVEMKPPQYRSTAVHSFGWEPIKSGLRGNVHIQFCDKAGNLTSRGYFENVQRSIYFGLEQSMKPGRFIHDNLKEHFKWVRLDDRPVIDETLPDVVTIPPSSVAPTEADITAAVDAQRIQPRKEDLFE